ncbi:MAG: LysM peptidoglycan-binding domain-containing protein [candidate division KSB1 bacterium]|nr:LysM peptidoglycan-binding domain-containing protein [candidate division KSB1 bacterium]
MKVSSKMVLTLIVGMLSLALAAPVLAQEKMSMEEYQRQLNDARQREATANAEIAKVDAEIVQLKSELANLDQQIAQGWDEIYTILGTDKAGVDAYRNQLSSIERDVEGLMAISPEELFRRRAEIDQLQARLNEMKKSKIFALTEMQDMVARIEGKITQLRARMPKAVYDEYTVVRGDYLWKISGKRDIYGDPYQWMRIYSYNRDLIKDPDLIYPQQVFKVQREVGPEEYLVTKGDFLAKIAGSMMNGEPTKWMKIYEANKDVIGEDPSRIYPYTVLRIPK